MRTLSDRVLRSSEAYTVTPCRSSKLNRIVGTTLKTSLIVIVEIDDSNTTSLNSFGSAVKVKYLDITNITRYIVVNTPSALANLKECIVLGKIKGTIRIKVAKVRVKYRFRYQTMQYEVP